MARPFAITSSSEALRLGSDGHGEASFTVTNTTARSLGTRLVVRPLGGSQAAWFTPPLETEIGLEPGKTTQHSVRLAVPPGVGSGKFTFRLDAVSIERPDEDFTEGPPISFELTATPAPAAKPFPWWILVVAGVVLLLVTAVVLALVLGRKPGLDQPCKRGQCAAGLLCSATDVCVGDMGFKGCASGAQCDSGVCTQATCVRAAALGEPCTEGTCTTGLTCAVGTCRAPDGFNGCRQDAQCLGGACLAGTCGAPRAGLGQPCPDGTCADGLTCSVGVCRAPDGFRGCAQHADCLSDACRDSACVALPYGPKTCLQGFVWREASAGDLVCVTPDVRAETAQENALADARRSPTGGPYGPNTCLSGFVWREAYPNDVVCVPPSSRSRAAADNAQAHARLVRQP